MIQKPLVSVVLCTYNGSKYIEEQLNSILFQTYINTEIIIADDHSTDGTVPVLKRYVEKDKRIKLFLNESNLGYNRNFENACTLASGEYIAIADQDDIWDKSKLEYLINEISKSPGTLLIHSNSALFKTGKRLHTGSVKSRHPFEGNDARALFYVNQISGHNMLFRKSLLDHALPFPENLYYDWWLAITACCYGKIKQKY